MSEALQKYKWGDILQPADARIQMTDEEIYPLASIRRRNGGFFHRETKSGKEILTKTLSRLIPNSFVISKMQVVHGACAYAPDNFDGTFVSASYVQFLPKKPERIDTKFLHYYSHLGQSYSGFLRSSHGVHIEKMTFDIKDWMKSEVSLPPLPEQKKIASILTSVDEVIEKTQSQIDKLQDLKKGTMNELLTKGIGHTEFKDSELGRIPKSWEVKSLNQVCLKIQDGTHFSPSTEGDSFKYITSKNIRMGHLILDNVETISEVEHRKIYKRCDVVKNDLLLTKDGANTGNIAINHLDEEFSLLSSVALIRPDKGACDAQYLLQFMMSDKAQNEIVEQMSGNAITRLTLTKINNFKVILPSLSEQTKIALSLRSIDQHINDKNQKLHQTQSLKKSLMQDLLTGKVRVSVN